MPASRAGDRSRASDGPSPVEMARYHDIWVITRRTIGRPSRPSWRGTRSPVSASFTGICQAGRAFGSAADVVCASLLLPLAAAHPRHRPRPPRRSEVRLGSSRNLRPVLGSELSVLPGCTVSLGAGRRRRVGAEELLAGRRVVERAVREFATGRALDRRARAFRAGDGAAKRGCACHYRRELGAAARAWQQERRDLFADRVARRRV